MESLEQIIRNQGWFFQSKIVFPKRDDVYTYSLETCMCKSSNQDKDIVVITLSHTACSCARNDFKVTDGTQKPITANRSCVHNWAIYNPGMNPTGESNQWMKRQLQGLNLTDGSGRLNCRKLSLYCATRRISKIIVVNCRWSSMWAPRLQDTDQNNHRSCMNCQEKNTGTTAN